MDWIRPARAFEPEMDAVRLDRGKLRAGRPGGKVHDPGHRCRLDLLLRAHRCQRCWRDHGRVAALAARGLWHLAQPIAVPKSVAVTLTIRAAVAADRPRNTDLDFLGLVERQHHDPRLRRNGRPGHCHRAALVLEMQFTVAWSVERPERNWTQRGRSQYDDVVGRDLHLSGEWRAVLLHSGRHGAGRLKTKRGSRV